MNNKYKYIYECSDCNINYRSIDNYSKLGVSECICGGLLWYTPTQVQVLKDNNKQQLNNDYVKYLNKITEQTIIEQLYQGYYNPEIVPNYPCLESMIRNSF